MNLTDAPAYTPTPFANSGTKNTIPVPSQPGGAASFTDGFPAPTFEPIGSGGVPPAGADFNGILNSLSAGQRWQQAGGVYGYDATFASAIGGYPKNAMLKRADGNGYWLNLTDANATNPDSGGAGWASVRANIGTSTIAMVAGNNTPTADKLAAETLLLTGSLATAATLVLPLTAGANWIVVNNTTGAGTVNVQGATGASVPIPQATALQVYTDGVGFYAIAAPVTGSYLPLHGTADAATVLATPRAFSITGLATAAVVNFDGSANVVLNVTSLDVAGALGYTPANNANVVHTSGNETVGGVKTFTSAMNGTSATFSGAMKALSFQETSSRKFKTGLKPLRGALDLVLRMKAWRGRYKKRLDPAQSPRLFFLTEELRDVLPEAVGEDGDSANYAAAVPLLVAAVQELAARVAELERDRG